MHMKIGFFTDSHYSSQTVTCGNRYNSKSLEKVKDAYRFFMKENCDLVVCLGDLIDIEGSHQKEVENLKEIAAVIQNCPIRTVCLMGNHDAFAFTVEEFYDVLGGCRPENLYLEGKILLFLDACYYENGMHYMPGDTDYINTFYPYIQELEQCLSSVQGDVYLFLHQNLDINIGNSVYFVNNIEQINALLRSNPSVKAVYQGHYHKGKNSVHDGIRYVTFPAMCEHEQAYFIEEL